MNDEFHDEQTRRLVEEEIGERTMSEERVDEILRDIEDMEVRLAEDPISRGPRFLITQIAKIRNYMSDVQTYREEIQNHLTRLKRRRNDLRSEYEVRYNSVRINNEWIRDFGASKDRDAACEHELQDLKVRIENLESEIEELDAVLEVVNNRFRNLEQTGWDIRKQKELIEDELKISNSSWTEAPPEGASENVDESDLDPDYSEVEGTEVDVTAGNGETGVGDLIEDVDTEDSGDKVRGPEIEPAGSGEERGERVDEILGEFDAEDI